MNMSNVVKDRFIGTSHRFNVNETWLTIPNAVTSFGIVCVVTYAWVLISHTAMWMVPLLVLIAVLSDATDGAAADYFNQHSAVGQVLDPLRDRMLTAVILTNLYLLSPTKTVIGMILVAILVELVAAGASAYLWQCRGQKLTAHAIGKARAALQWLVSFLPLVAAYWFHLDPQRLVLPAVAVIMAASVLASIFYVYRALSLAP